jgi:hypothetical protein
MWGDFDARSARSTATVRACLAAPYRAVGIYFGGVNRRGRRDAGEPHRPAHRESVLVYGVEAYRIDDASCRSAVLAFMNAWTSRLHDLGYLSGFYSSMASGVADQVAAYRTSGHAHPTIWTLPAGTGTDGVRPGRPVTAPAGQAAPGVDATRPGAATATTT